MNIGQAAKLSGINAKLIRHYETIGVVPRAARTESRYRTYSESDVHILRFVNRARSLGFSMKQIKDLLGLWHNKKRSSADVKRLAQVHIHELEVKIAELEQMASTLRHLAHHCNGDHRPDCPILDEIAQTNQ